MITTKSKAEVPLPSDRVMENCVDDSTCSNSSLTNSTISGPNNAKKQDMFYYTFTYCNVILSSS